MNAQEIQHCLKILEEELAYLKSLKYKVSDNGLPFALYLDKELLSGAVASHAIHGISTYTAYRISDLEKQIEQLKGVDE